MRLLHKFTLVQALTLVIVSALVVLPFNSLYAADLADRSLTLGDSVISNTTYHNFQFDIISGGAIGSIEFEYCSNDPFPGFPCTPPTGFDISGAGLLSEIGETGFAIHGSTTANRMVLTRTPAIPVPGTVQYIFDNVINPDTAGSHYVRLGTFASDDGTGPRIDQGGLAFRLLDPISLDAYVPPILYFCVGKTITGHDCLTATGAFTDFGDLSALSTAYTTTQMVIGTNAFGGYTISAIGTTMTSGNKVINNLTTPTVSITGNEQFGINLRNNSAPNVGLDVDGVGVGVVSADYNIPNRYKYMPGEIVAYSLTTSETNKYTTSYIVNVRDDQAPGIYSTTITYVALASF